MVPAKLREPMTLFTAILAVATIVLVFVSFLQWHTLSQQAVTMEKTDETMRAGERAFVFQHMTSLIGRQQGSPMVKFFAIMLLSGRIVATRRQVTW
jgi:hypothetical protein